MLVQNAIGRRARILLDYQNSLQAARKFADSHEIADPMQTPNRKIFKAMSHVMVAWLVVNCLLLGVAILLGRWPQVALLAVCAALGTLQYRVVARLALLSLGASKGTSQRFMGVG